MRLLRNQKICPSKKNVLTTKKKVWSINTVYLLTKKFYIFVVFFLRITYKANFNTQRDKFVHFPGIDGRSNTIVRYERKLSHVQSCSSRPAQFDDSIPYSNTLRDIVVRKLNFHSSCRHRKITSYRSLEGWTKSYEAKFRLVASRENTHPKSATIRW